MSLKDNTSKLINLEGLNEYDKKIKQRITDRIQAKVQAFVCKDLTNIVRTTGTSIPDDSQDSYELVKTITTISGKTEGIIEENGTVKSTVNVGDTIFLTDPNISDWWISAIAYDSSSTPPTPISFTITKLETQKINLDAYATNDALNAFSGRLAAVEEFQINATADIQTIEEEIVNDLRPLVDKVSALENKQIATTEDISGMFSSNS